MKKRYWIPLILLSPFIIHLMLGSPLFYHIYNQDEVFRQLADKALYIPGLIDARPKALQPFALVFGSIYLLIIFVTNPFKKTGSTDYSQNK